MTANTTPQTSARKPSVVKQMVSLLRSPASERNRLIRIHAHFLAARICDFKRFYLSYQPDSHAIFDAYPEFDRLFHGFTKHNKLNNSGDIPRLWSVILNMAQIIEEGIAGDFAELGVWKGNTASVLADIAFRNDRQLYLFDTFQGFNPDDIKGVDSDKDVSMFDDTSVDLVKEVIGEASKCCHFVKGHFPSSISGPCSSTTYSAVSLDCDLYEPMKAALAFFYARMSTGGIFLVHDYSSRHWAGAKLAVDEFCKEAGEFVVLLPDKSGSAFLRKTK